MFRASAVSGVACAAVFAAATALIDIQAFSSAPSGLICSGAVGVGGCWREFDNRKGCYRWLIRSKAEESFTWSGECPDGIASGTGVMEHNYQRPHWKDLVTTTKEGTFVDGLEEGHWVIRWSIEEWSAEGVDEGPYVNGRQQGHWVLRRPGGLVQEGTLVNGRRHGHWVISEQGRIVEEGAYVDGARDGHWKLYGPDGTVEEGTMLPSHSKDGDWTVRKADGSVYTETYSEGELIGTGPAADDTAAADDVSGEVADTSSTEQQVSGDSAAAADSSSAETQSVQASLDLPSPDECMRVWTDQEDYDEYKGISPDVAYLRATNECGEHMRYYLVFPGVIEDMSFNPDTDWDPDSGVEFVWPTAEGMGTYTAILLAGHRGEAKHEGSLGAGAIKQVAVDQLWEICFEYIPQERHVMAGYSTCEESNVPELYWKCPVEGYVDVAEPPEEYVGPLGGEATCFADGRPNTHHLW